VLSNSGEIAEELQEAKTRSKPPDLIAEALARRNIDGAIQLMEDKKARGFNLNDTSFYLSLLLNQRGTEALAANNAAAIEKMDSSIGWGERSDSDFIRRLTTNEHQSR
jgi:hypothetical protein